MRDSLFDKHVTVLDFVKLGVLVFSGFATWQITGILTAGTSYAVIRQVAALVIIEGSFLAFEYATLRAKNPEQSKIATAGFFGSLAMLVLFTAIAGFLEFAGPSVLGTVVSNRFGIPWTAQNIVQIGALIAVVTWLAVFSTTYRLYSLADPDKRREFEAIKHAEAIETEVNETKSRAIGQVKSRIAVERVLGQLRAEHVDDLAPEELEALLNDVREMLWQRNALEQKTGRKSRELPAPANTLPNINVSELSRDQLDAIEAIARNRSATYLPTGGDAERDDSPFSPKPYPYENGNR